MQGVDGPTNLTRRAAVILGCAGLAAAPPEPRRLAFEAWRNGRRIGRHQLSFTGDDQDFVVAIEAELAVGIGPITVFRYRHQASETWRGGRFSELRSRTVTNGRREQVVASSTAGGVAVTTAAGAHTLAANAAPLTHWNPHVLAGPLFNPQTGAALRERVLRQDGQTLTLADGRAIGASRYVLTGDADIIDWYDLRGQWSALRARAADGSTVDYRRVAAA